MGRSGPTGVRQRTVSHPNPDREGTEQGVEIRRLAYEPWECHEEGADMRLEDTKGKLRFCCYHSFVNALTGDVVTEQVPINTNFLIPGLCGR